MRPTVAACFVLALALAPHPARAASPSATEAALREGNRLFRRGELAAAVEAYRRGTGGGRTDPLLAYNLGTALHRLDRLPEAVLWYRRAQAAGSRDPWLAENLVRARRDLGAPRRGPPALVAPLLRHRWLAPAAAALLAWAALVAALRAPPDRRLGVGALLAASLLLWGGGLALRRLGPRPAVLLAPCSRDLPAGSEVWVTPDSAGAVRVVGSRVRCAAAEVGTVAPG